MKDQAPQAQQTPTPAPAGEASPEVEAGAVGEAVETMEITETVAAGEAVETMETVAAGEAVAAGAAGKASFSSNYYATLAKLEGVKNTQEAHELLLKLVKEECPQFFGPHYSPAPVKDQAPQAQQTPTPAPAGEVAAPEAEAAAGEASPEVEAGAAGETGEAVAAVEAVETTETVAAGETGEAPFSSSHSTIPANLGEAKNFQELVELMAKFVEEEHPNCPNPFRSLALVKDQAPQAQQTPTPAPAGESAGPEAEAPAGEASPEVEAGAAGETGETGEAVAAVEAVAAGAAGKASFSSSYYATLAKLRETRDVREAMELMAKFVEEEHPNCPNPFRSLALVKDQAPQAQQTPTPAPAGEVAAPEAEAAAGETTPRAGFVAESLDVVRGKVAPPREGLELRQGGDYLREYLRAVAEDSPEEQQRAWENISRELYHQNRQDRVLADLADRAKARGLADPALQWSPEALEPYRGRLLHNLWKGDSQDTGTFKLVQTSTGEVMELACSASGCNLIKVNPAEEVAATTRRRVAMLHSNLCQQLDRPDPLRELELPWNSPIHHYAVQLDSLALFRALGYMPSQIPPRELFGQFYSLLRRQERAQRLGEALPEEEQRLLRDSYLELMRRYQQDGLTATVERWMDLFAGPTPEEMDGPDTVCGFLPQIVRNSFYQILGRQLLPSDSPEYTVLNFWGTFINLPQVQRALQELGSENRLEFHRALHHWQFRSSAGPKALVYEHQIHYGATTDSSDTLGGVFSLLSPLSQLLLWLLESLALGLGSYPRYPSGSRAPASSYECGFAPFAAISSSSLVVFRQLAVYFVVFEAELIFLYPWSAALLPSSSMGSALGYYGALPFLLCLVVGFGLEIKRDALKL